MKHLIMVLPVCVILGVVFLAGWVVGGEQAAASVRNELFQAECKQSGGRPAYNGRFWDCIGVKPWNKT